MGERTCVIDGCDRPTGVPGTARGWCRRHYGRWQEHGDPLATPKRTPSWNGASCTVEGCEKPIDGHGLCEMHLTRKRRYGTVDLPPRPVKQCSIDGCADPFYGDDLCRWHYDQHRGPRPGTPDPERARLSAKRRRAVLAGATGDHTEAEWQAKLVTFEGRCAYCGAAADTKDHLIPISRGGTHDIDNIVPACRPCNSSKGARTFVEWISGVRVKRTAREVA